jgi:RNA polymerase sigma-70 factor (ECF subfamily)
MEKDLGQTWSQAFGELYDEFMPRIYRYIGYRVGNRQDAEDLTSVVFEKAASHHEKYDGQKASFSTWVFTIAHNTLIDYYRSHDRKIQSDSLELAEPLLSQDSNPQEAIENNETIRLLSGCLSSLKQQDLDLIQLKFSAEFNNKEISRIMGISEVNVRKRLERTLKRLKSSLEEAQDV